MRNNNKKVKETEGYNHGGILSDNDIRELWGEGKDIFITTNHDYGIEFNMEEQVQLGSIDLHLGHEYKLLDSAQKLDVKGIREGKYVIPQHLEKGQPLILKPHDMILTTTLEQVRLSRRIAGFITGRSSVARLGVMVQCCQEFINPGHGQQIPLQLINLSPCNVELDLEVPVCQLVLMLLRTPASGAYSTQKDSKYRDEVNGPMASRYWEDSRDTGDEDEPGTNRVYIASKYSRTRLNNQIYDRLKRENIDVFLPESINVEAKSDSEKREVAEQCYEEIDKCSIILAVCPFGKSVSAELGYAISQKRMGYRKTIIMLNTDDYDEAMIDPYIDKHIFDVKHDLNELVEYIKNLK